MLCKLSRRKAWSHGNSTISDETYLTEKSSGSSSASRYTSLVDSSLRLEYRELTKRKASQDPTRESGSTDRTPGNMPVVASLYICGCPAIAFGPYRREVTQFLLLRCMVPSFVHLPLTRDRHVHALHRDKISHPNVVGYPLLGNIWSHWQDLRFRELRCSFSNALRGYLTPNLRTASCGKITRRVQNLAHDGYRLNTFTGALTGYHSSWLACSTTASLVEVDVALTPPL